MSIHVTPALLALVLTVAQASDDLFGGATEGVGGAAEAEVPLADPAEGAARDFDSAPGASAETMAVRRRIARDRARARLLRQEEASILGAFGAIDAELRENKRARDVLLKREAARAERVRHTNEAIEAHASRAARVRDAVGRRVLGLQRLSRTRLEQVLKRTGARSEARRMSDWLRLVLAHDAKLLAEGRAVLDASSRLQQELETERQALADARDELAGRSNALAELRDEKAALLDAVRTERRASERLARELTEQARRQEREAGILRGAGPQPDAVAGGFSAQKGLLPWPAVGQVVASFGKKVDAATGLVFHQRGIELAAADGTPVRAVFDGRVVHAGRLRGFGSVVILEHDSWYTVYGQLGRLRVSEGLEVRQHEVLGWVRSAPGRARSLLYFEVRRGKEPVDPLRWLGS